MRIIFILILITIFSSSLYSQAYREIYTKQIILNENDDNNNNLYIIQTPTLTQSVTFTIPVGKGQNGDILTSNGVNSTTWTGLNAGQAGGSGDWQIQFKNSTFDGSSSFIWDNTNQRVGIDVVAPDYSLHSSGTINIGGPNNQGVLAIQSQNSGGNYLYILPNSSTTQTVVFILPADNGAANKGLVSTSSGSLSWGGELRKGPVSNNEPTDNEISNNPNYAYIGGGTDNEIENSAHNSTIYGGNDNDIENSAQSASLFAGNDNDIDNSAHKSVVLGGYDNSFENSAQSAALVGGTDNEIDNSAHYSFIGGGNNNEFNNSAQSSIIFGGSSNLISNSSDFSIIGAGNSNILTGDYSGLLTGSSNELSNTSQMSVLFSGNNNEVDNSTHSIIGSGTSNVVKAYSAVLGGQANTMNNSSNYNVILYGHTNRFDNGGTNSFMAGRDIEMKNSGQYSTHLGRKLYNDNGRDGVLLLGDANTNQLSSNGHNQFRARFSNGYRLWTNAASTVGVSMNAGDNTWASVSDRNLKESIVTLNPLTFLNKIKELDIFSWTYKGFEDKGIRNYGPMAQDFYALFGEDEYGVYGNDTSIKELDAASIFILGVQGSSIEIENQKEILSENVEKSNLINSKLEELEKRLKKIESSK